MQLRCDVKVGLAVPAMLAGAKAKEKHTGIEQAISMIFQCVVRMTFWQLRGGLTTRYRRREHRQFSILRLLPASDLERYTDYDLSVDRGIRLSHHERSARESVFRNARST
jgi:hypothetical protein